jgi:type I restriction enzyme, S subunit
MELKPGYKLTEVGVIPEDWEVRSLGTLGSFSKGRGIRKNEAASGEIPCIRYGEIYTHHDDIIRFYNSRISATVAMTSKLLRKGDLLFAGSGETKDEIGKCVAFVDEGEVYAGGDIVVLSPTTGSSEYFGYLLNAPFVARQKASKGQGDAVVHINSSALASVSIPLPSDPEQRAIATALSDVDGLLGGLDCLIAKRRDLKQVAMQQLLTGQIRLPGFAPASQKFKQTDAGIIPGDWNLCHIENFAHITTGSKNTQDKIQDGNFPFFVRSQIVEHINSYSFDGEAVLTAGDGVGTGKVFHYINGKFDVHQRVYLISNFHESVSGYFFYLYFSTHFYNRIMQMTAKSSVDSVRRDMIAKMHVPLPPTKSEQTAIAEVLSPICLY